MQSYNNVLRIILIKKKFIKHKRTKHQQKECGNYTHQPVFKMFVTHTTILVTAGIIGITQHTNAFLPGMQ
jgi:hypothetical protein